LTREEDARNDLTVVRGLVKRFDRDRYWSALFAPEPVRSHLLALYAFNVELSRIPAQVSEAMFGEVRLQWWRTRSTFPARASAAQIRWPTRWPGRGSVSRCR
jgi:phytoene/squalene synthetase